MLDVSYVREVRQSLDNAAAALPVPATAEVIETDWYDAVQQALDTHRPLLLIAGLTATHGRLEEWLTLPLAHQTGYPLLLVPEHLPAANLKPPHRLVLAVEDRAFTLTLEARALAPLLDALGCEVITTTVFSPASREDAASGDAGWHAVQRSGLATAVAHSPLHKVVDARPAAGIWQAVDELEADVLALLDQGHGWVHKMFSSSTVTQAIRFSQVPVLLLSASLNGAADAVD